MQGHRWAILARQQLAMTLNTHLPCARGLSVPEEGVLVTAGCVLIRQPPNLSNRTHNGLFSIHGTVQGALVVGTLCALQSFRSQLLRCGGLAIGRGLGVPQGPVGDPSHRDHRTGDSSIGQNSTPGPRQLQGLLFREV